jgi:hypothetical protein
VINRAIDIDICASSALPMPEACMGDSVPGGKNARMLAWVSTWLTNNTKPLPRDTEIGGLAGLFHQLAQDRARAIDQRLVRRKKRAPITNARGPICQTCSSAGVELHQTRAPPA